MIDIVYDLFHIPGENLIYYCEHFHSLFII